MLHTELGFFEGTAAGGLGEVLISLIGGLFFPPGGDPIASCDGCFCIPEPGETCPTTVPETDYDQATIDALNEQTPLNPIGLFCDPFTDNTCETYPPQDPTLVALGEEAVCGLLYTDASCSTYSLQSYPNRAAAEADGAFVTHVGVCGVCSTTQDLSTYLSVPDLASGTRRCSSIAVFEGFDLGFGCFQEFGFSEPCAKVWAYNGQSGGSNNCFLPCLPFLILDLPNNGPPPECELDPCIACDEEVNGETFSQIAGRTRRRSGLLSAIARPCDTIADITHVACPSTTT